MYSTFNNILLKLAELSLKKRDLLQSKYPQINLSELEQCDPTPTGEYINWLIKLYINKIIILPEDQRKIYTALKRYTLGKKENKLPQQYKDINFFKTYGDLAETLDQYLGKDLEEIKVMDGYNNSRVLFNQNSWEVVYVNDVDDLVGLSQGTKWCTKNQEYAEDYLKKGPLYLINKDIYRYCLIHPATNQMKDVYDRELKGKEEKEILDILTFYNIIPIDDITTIIVRRKYLNEQGYERYKEIALEKGKKNSNIADLLLRNYKTELNNEQKEIYVKSAIKKANNEYQLLIQKIITREEDGQLFFDLREKFTTEEYLKKYGYYEREIYSFLENKIIIREDGQLFFDARKQFIDEDFLEDPRLAYGLLKNKIITKEDGQLFINTSNSAMKFGQAYGLLENRIITKENGQIFFDTIKSAIKSNKHIYDLVKDKIITKEDFQIAQGINPNPNPNQQPQENTEEPNQFNQPIAKIINELLKQSQLLKIKEKIDYDIIMDIATEVFDNLKNNIFKTEIHNSYVILNKSINLLVYTLGGHQNDGEIIKKDNQNFKIIIGNISRFLKDDEKLLKYINSILVHEITHIPEMLEDNDLEEKPENYNKYINSQSERIALTNQIIRECVIYLNELSPKLISQRINLNDRDNNFIVKEILNSSETFKEIKNIINHSFLLQLEKSIKYLLYKFLND